MYYFANDYTEGAHEKVLEALVASNMEHLATYGFDSYTERAKEKIRLAADAPDADVYFISGGTQTNMVAIDAMLPSYSGVVSAVSGHIAGHEAGAIEYTGHKVITLPAKEGKLSAEELEHYLTLFHADGTWEHMVFPGMVYISHPTEYGTLYTKKELEALSRICRRYRIPLYLDGARLGYGLMSDGTDVTLSDIATLCDAFYIGGTKVGALCGEALVFPRKNLPPHFFTTIKQHGALLAKGRVTGVQFDALFTDNLYFRISRHAILMAMKLKENLVKRGLPLFMDSPTNQQFVILDNELMKRLEEHVVFSVWEPYDDTHTVVRFATSWATTEEDVAGLDALFAELLA
ncbi:MAG: aminotransferase class V-fold PLP-dependent enzyme [Clostridia bacterium]|nr:aminotransferase class V-fold PLP-dependent enzyme [Clostridia bacterium]